MFMTVAEGHVAEENWGKLQEVYAASIANLDPEIIQTFLVQNYTDRTLWKIITIWPSVDVVRARRRPGETPPADRMFLVAGAQPTHDVFDIALQGTTSRP